MAFIIILDIILAAALGIPLYRARKAWEEWVGRSSLLTRRFVLPKRFGWRSWAARSFVLNARIEDVHAKIDILPEKDLDSNAPMGSELLAMASMLGKTKFDTGITVDWIDNHTAELKAQQHADWPALREDWEHLPLRQRQRLAEHLILHVEPEQGNKTKVSYEVETPLWVLITVAAGFLLMCWITWRINLTHNPLLKFNMVYFWALAVWIAGNLVRIAKLQNISLLDNLVSTFGPIAPGKE